MNFLLIAYFISINVKTIRKKTMMELMLF